MIDTNLNNGMATRLRERPVARGISDSQTLDIPVALEHLCAESYAAGHGHRQVTLFHQAPVTLVLFALDTGGELPDNVAQSVVSIQPLDSTLTMHAAGADHPGLNPRFLIPDTIALNIFYF